MITLSVSVADLLGYDLSVASRNDELRASAEFQVLTYYDMICGIILAVKDLIVQSVSVADLLGYDLSGDQAVS